MNSPNPTRVAIVGCGSIARKTYLPCLEARDDVEVVAVWSRSDATLATVSRRFASGCCTTDFNRVLDAGADCAFVLTDWATHSQYSIPLLESGADVLCEKPMAWTLSQCEQMVEAAARSGRLLMIGFNRRYSRPFVRAREFFEGRTVELCMVERGKTSGGPRSITEDIVHNLDLLRWYCGEPVKVSAHATGAGEFGASLGAMVLFESGAVGFSSVTFSAGTWFERATVSGEGRSAFIDAPDRVTLVERGGDASTEDLVGRLDGWAGPAEAKGFRSEIDHFLECCRTRQQPLTSGEDALKSMALLDAVCRKAGIQPLE